MGQPTPPSKPAAASPARRRLTILAWVIAIAAALVLLLTHSPLTARFVLPRLTSALGVRVNAESVRIQLDGMVILSRPRFTLESDTLSGPAATLAEAVSAKGHLDFWAAVRGSIILDKLTLEDPVVRISQNVDSGALNLGALQFNRSALNQPATAPFQPTEIPIIVVHHGALELGEHTDRGYTLLKRIAFDGTIEPVTGDRKSFGIHFAQTLEPGSSSASHMTIEGTVDEQGVTASLQGFALADWPPSVLPTPIRGQFSSLELEGAISRANIHYDFRGFPTTSLELANVAVSLPVDAETAENAPPRKLRMARTNGTIELDRAGLRANIRGMVEDVPYRANLIFTGTDPEGPFTLELSSEGYSLGKTPAFRRFVNDTVKARMHDFGDPTGRITMSVQITRAAKVGAAPGPLSTKGFLRIAEGTAAFHKFPYPFSGLEGDIEFSDDAIHFRRLVGRNPATGATIRCVGTISPLNDDAGVDLDILVEHIPIDAELERAMKPGERAAISALFSAPDIAALSDRGMIATAANIPALTAKLQAAETAGDAAQAAQLREVLAHRRFEPRGTASISVRLLRPPGPDKDYQQDIRVKCPGAGIVSDAFPLPVIADEFELRIGDDDVQIFGRNMRAFAGGTADLKVSMPLMQLRENPDLVPAVEVQAHDVVLDDLAKYAADRTVRKFAGRSSARIAEIVRDFHAGGAASGSVSILPDPARPASAHVALALSGLTAAPAPAGFSPTITLDHTQFNLSTRADQFEITASGTSHAGAVQSPFEVRVASAEWNGPDPARRDHIDVAVRGTGMDLSADTAPVLEVFSHAAATRVNSITTSLAPAGNADLRTDLRIAPSGDLDALTLNFANLKNPRLTLLSTPVALSDCRGSVTVHASAQAPDAARVEFHELKAAIIDAGSTSHVECDGHIMVADDHGATVPAGDLQIRLTDARFESSALRGVAIGALPRLKALIDDYDPHGQFALDARWQPGPRGTFIGALEPRTLEITRDHVRLGLADVGGRMEFDAQRATLRGISIHSPTFHAQFDGAITFASDADPASHMDIGVALKGSGIQPDLLALLPRQLRGVLDDLKVHAPDTTPIELTDTRITQTSPPDGRDTTQVSGRLLFSDLSMDAGVDITDAAGELLFATTRTAESPMTFQLEASLSSARAAGVTLTNGRVRVTQGATDGDVLIPSVSAACHGGLIDASGALQHPASTLPGAPAHFDFTLRASGVRFAPLVDELKAVESAAASTDTSRGILDATLSIAGSVGAPDSRRGRFFATVGGGEVAQIPGMVALVKLANFQLPLSEPLDHARASAHIDGTRIGFDELSIASSGISLIGYGTMQWPSTELDLRFNSRSNRRLPIISRVVESLRDELITTKVTGTIKEPAVSMENLPGPAAILRSLSGRATEQDLRLQRMRSDSQRTNK